jgi:hypothetical protein
MQKKIIYFIFFIIAAAAGFLLLFNKNGRNDGIYAEIKSKCAIPGSPIISPSKKYALIVTGGYDGTVEYNKFSIAGASVSSITNEVVFESIDRFRTRDSLFFLWGKNDSVWVYSGDTGTFYWEKSGENEWTKWSFAQKPCEPPELLVKLKPRNFENYNWAQ